MTKEDIIRMVREIADKDKVDPYSNGFVVLTPEEMERFATVIVDAEREACAQIAKDWDASHPHTNYGRCIANAIRARGQ